jgi:hypothetical protein
MIESYAASDPIRPSCVVEFGSGCIETVRFVCPYDLNSIDIVWVCMPLFTNLRFYDFFWLLLAVLQEKSVVFVAQDIGIVSSCVLAMVALLRPFKWPNLIIPIVPNSLREVIEAPVPLIAGVPYVKYIERQHCPNIIWVLLDEPNADRKVQGSSALVQEVAEPEIPQFKASLYEIYKGFHESKNTLVGNAEEKEKCLRIAKELKKFYGKIIDTFNGVMLNEENLTRILVGKFPNCDHKFIRAFVQTLVFQSMMNEIGIKG